MVRDVALVTPSHRNDIERFALLCESIYRHVSGYEKHYVIVNDDDMPLFAQFGRHNVIVVPCSRLLPRWLKLIPSVLRKGRRIWWSFLTKPVHGWHIQQILKIAVVLRAPEQRFCLIDSDNVFIRTLDIKNYAGGEKAPLYVERAAISAEAPLHATWTRNCNRLLGREEPAMFPADDYVGNLIVWDKTAVQDMTLAIEGVTNKAWAHALCRTRDFSEYLLYGHFVRNSPRHLAHHEIITESLANAYWGYVPLDSRALTAMVNNMPESKVALCIESFSRTPVSIIRDAVGLRRRPVEAAQSSYSLSGSARQLGSRLHEG
ncbi:MAG: DUF6492 family protein [Steroidobacteraceae bacterium]